MAGVSLCFICEENDLCYVKFEFEFHANVSAAGDINFDTFSRISSANFETCPTFVAAIE